MTVRYRQIKRIVDIITALAMLLLALPVCLLVIMVLKLTGEHKIFYTQDRIGYRNRRFRIIKFCSMREGSERHGSVTVRGDARVLPVGRVLRATKLNELPQLINVLAGDMSIVGPRPLVDEGFGMYPQEIQRLIYTYAKPGITGLGSIVFRNEEELLARSEKSVIRTYKEDIMPTKGALELWYGKHMSMGLDFRIMLVTAIRLILPKSQIYRMLLPDLPDSCRDLS